MSARQALTNLKARFTPQMLSGEHSCNQAIALTEVASGRATVESYACLHGDEAITQLALGSLAEALTAFPQYRELTIGHAYSIFEHALLLSTTKQDVTQLLTALAGVPMGVDDKRTIFQALERRFVRLHPYIQAFDFENSL